MTVNSLETQNSGSQTDQVTTEVVNPSAEQVAYAEAMRRDEDSDFDTARVANALAGLHWEPEAN